MTVYEELITQGKLEGKLEGKQEASKAFIKNLIKDGFDSQHIARLVNVDISQVLSIKAHMAAEINS